MILIGCHLLILSRLQEICQWGGVQHRKKETLDSLQDSFVFCSKVENLNSYWDYPTITNPYSAAPNFSCTEFNKTLDYAPLVLILSFIMHYTKIISIMLPTIFPAAFVTTIATMHTR